MAGGSAIDALVVERVGFGAVGYRIRPYRYGGESPALRMLCHTRSTGFFVLAA